MKFLYPTILTEDDLVNSLSHIKKKNYDYTGTNPTPNRHENMFGNSDDEQIIAGINDSLHTESMDEDEHGSYKLAKNHKHNF
mmetsp:Transcript_19769/g.18820  ORF Transcript_19769/g.18820 Transcript_19769/m.18820 type:complete len:82 (-) Transcript_19769:197-442(-)